MQRICIHITGASGSGVSTTGRSLASRLGAPCFDTDDFFWIPTDPPYQTVRVRVERLRLIEDAIDRHASWVLAGSIGEWGNVLIPRFDLVVFLYVPTTVRIARLKARERERYGEKLDPGGAMHGQHLDFIAWAAGYDAPDVSISRSLQGHLDWLKRLPCPVLRIEGEHTTEVLVDRIVAAANNSGLRSPHEAERNAG